MCIHIGQETTMTLLLSGKLWAPHNSYTTLVEANIRSIHCHRSLKKEAVRKLKESLDLAAIDSKGTDRLLVLFFQLTKVQLPLPKEDETDQPIQLSITRLVTSSTTIHLNPKSPIVCDPNPNSPPVLDIQTVPALKPTKTAASSYREQDDRSI